MSEQPSEKNNNATAKAVGIGGGGGIGAILLNLSELIHDETVKRTVQSAIPLLSIGLTSAFSFICEVYLLEPAEYKNKLRIKRIKKKLQANIKDKNLTPAARELAREKYSLICQMESENEINAAKGVNVISQRTDPSSDI